MKVKGERKKGKVKGQERCSKRVAGVSFDLSPSIFPLESSTSIH
jgi:hypothetical protein